MMSCAPRPRPPGTIDRVAPRGNLALLACLIGLGGCSFDAKGLGQTSDGGGPSSSTDEPTSGGSSPANSTGLSTGASTTGLSTGASTGSSTTDAALSSTSTQSSESTASVADLPTQCPEPDCDPKAPSCPGEQVCHPVMMVCLEPCSPDCRFYCINEMVHYDPRGFCPRCDTGNHPGECIVQHFCESDAQCEPFGQKCAVWLGWCMVPCTTPEACEWQCIDADENKLGTDLCSFCDVGGGLEP